MNEIYNVSRNEKAGEIERPFTLLSDFDKLLSTANKLEKEGSECEQDPTLIESCMKAFTVKWDQQLNDTYRAVLKSLPDKETEKLLQDSEIQWIKFKDADAKVSDNIKDPVLKLAAKEDVIRDRANELLSYGIGIENQDAVPDQIKAQQDETNAIYREFLHTLDDTPGARKAAETSQHEWTAFMQKEYKFIDAIAPLAPRRGSDSHSNSVLKINIVRDRGRELLTPINSRD